MLNVESEMLECQEDRGRGEIWKSAEEKGKLDLSEYSLSSLRSHFSFSSFQQSQEEVGLCL